MKKYFLILVLFLDLLIASSLHSQSPSGIPYQAVMRNADGSLIANSPVNLIIMIHDGTADGTVVYQESHTLTSNSQGLVSCVVGNGLVSYGTFASIIWGRGAKFLHLMIGSADLGTQQIMSVPYALYADNIRISVSTIGDTLTVGRQSVIVPGISAANPQVLYSQGTGVTDIDGNFYPTIIINGQEWMQKNLTVSKYRNGDPIQTDLTDDEWISTINGAYAMYNFELYDSLYGKLYNWYTITENRGLCPSGWHVPIEAEWNSIINYLDQMAEGGDNANNISGGKMKATIDWRLPNVAATNLSGFSGLPGGYSYDVTSLPGDTEHMGVWWSGTENGTNNAWSRTLTNENSGVIRAFDDKNYGFSIRCIRD